MTMSVEQKKTYDQIVADAANPEIPRKDVELRQTKLGLYGDDWRRLCMAVDYAFERRREREARDREAPRR